MAAVAPLPMTTTRAPSTSRSSGHSWAWKYAPANRSTPREVGQVTLVVAVVAGAGDDPPAPEPDDVSPVASVLDVERPARLGSTTTRSAAPAARSARDDAGRARRPRRRGSGGSHRTVGDGVVAGPRLPRVRVGLHVGVGAHAGVAEQVPRPADRVPRFEHGERQVGELGPQVHRPRRCRTRRHRRRPRRTTRPRASPRGEATPGRRCLHVGAEATVVLVGERPQRRAAVTLERRAVHDREAGRREVGQRADRARRSAE